MVGAMPAPRRDRVSHRTVQLAWYTAFLLDLQLTPREPHTAPAPYLMPLLLEASEAGVRVPCLQ
jgi:hypothetical protein